MMFEGCGDGETGGKVATEGVNEYVDGFTVVDSQNLVHGVTVEVRASDVTLKSYVICCFGHGVIVYATKLLSYNKEVKDNKPEKID